MSLALNRCQHHGVSLACFVFIAYYCVWPNIHPVTIKQIFLESASRHLAFTTPERENALR